MRDAISYYDGRNDQTVGSLFPLPITIGGTKYETVAASQSTQAMGVSGAIGDIIAGVLVVPTTSLPGAITLKDGTNAAITIFTGSTTTPVSLAPFFISLGIKSVSGAWQITTGANVSAIGVGSFT